MTQSDIQNNRVMACRLARRTSDDFSETYGDSSLDSIAPFESDEIILGRRVGSGAFAGVYQIKDFSLRANESKKILGVSIGGSYTGEQIQKRDAAAKSVQNGVKYVMKSLKDQLEDSEEKDLFLDSAQDIVNEAEMLAAFSHPNIIELHGIIASRHESFAEGPSAFFIILERLDCTLEDKIEEWKKQNSFNPSSSLKALRGSITASMVLDKDKGEKSAAGGGGSLDKRLRMASSLAGAMKYLHEKGVIFHDLKPENVGVDKRGNVKLFDFGLAKFMPQHGDSYKDVYEMSGAGTPRYSAPEVFFKKSYNLKADVYSFAIVLWEMVGLKQPFPKCKKRKEFEQALPKLEKVLVIDKRWPLPIRGVIKRGLSKDLSDRPTMKEVCASLNEYFTSAAQDSEVENTRTPSRRTSRGGRSQSVIVASSSSMAMPKLGSSMTAIRGRRRSSFDTENTFEDLLEEVDHRGQ